MQTAAIARWRFTKNKFGMHSISMIAELSCFASWSCEGGGKFENSDQMDELLHIGFVKEGWEIPEEITEKVQSVANKEIDDERTHDVATIILKWAKIKESAGLIKIDLDNCSDTFCRFQTDAMTALLPDTPEAKSGWRTKNHYYYEVVND